MIAINNKIMTILLIAALVTNIDARVQRSTMPEEMQDKGCHIGCHKEKEHCKDSRIGITQKEVNKKGYIIKESGEYFLCEDVVYTPKYYGTPAIEIAASNVTLDLNGKTLSQVDKSVTGIVGVKVDQGLTNITIMNGTVTSFSKIGILAGDPTSTPGPTITNLKVSGVNALNNGNQTEVVSFPCELGGLIITSAQDIILENNNLNQNFLNGLGCSGIVKMSMTNCHCDDNTWANAQFSPPPSPTPNPAIVDSQAFGFSLFNYEPSSDVHIRHCTFDRTFFTGSGGSLVTDDFSGGPTESMVLDSCTGNGTTVIISDPAVVAAIPDGPHGLPMFLNVNDLTLINCQVLDCVYTLSASAPFPAQATFNPGGIELVGNNHSVINCNSGNTQFINNTGSPVRSLNFGFIVNANNAYLSGCTSFANTNVDPNAASVLRCYGFFASGSSNCVFEDCISSAHTQAAQSGMVAGRFSQVAGFNTSSGNSGSTIFRRCVASNNTDTFPGVTGGQAAGFSTHASRPSTAGLSTSVVFEECIAEANTTGTSTNFGCGFDLLNLADSKVINCIAEANNIGIQVSDFAPNQSSDNIISNNILLANTQFGVLDLTQTGTPTMVTNAYYENRAKANGATPAGFPNDTNYSRGAKTIKGAPIRGWILPGLPNTTDNNGIVDPLDNISINL